MASDLPNSWQAFRLPPTIFRRVLVFFRRTPLRHPGKLPIPSASSLRTLANKQPRGTPRGRCLCHEPDPRPRRTDLLLSLSGWEPSIPDPGKYWRLFNGPGLSPLEGGAVQLAVSPEAFLDLTQQHANQYAIAEALVAGKCKDHKRLCAEKSQGQPPEIKEKGLLRTPNPMKSPRELRDWTKYYWFHRDYGHDTEECHDLQNQIEELIRKGHLGRYVKRP
ncbi:hypothetical protein GW17_00047327 [Ensete ventricosum]|nr:hypothetical protein GW17_00047327 [Ensete ventricosum]